MIEVFLQRYIQCGSEHERPEHKFVVIESPELEKLLYQWHIVSVGIVNKGEAEK